MSPKCPSGWPEKAALIRTSPSMTSGQTWAPAWSKLHARSHGMQATKKLPRTLAEAQPAGVVKELAHALPSPRALVGRGVGADERLRTCPRIWIMRIDSKTYTRQLRSSKTDHFLFEPRRKYRYCTCALYQHFPHSPAATRALWDYTLSLDSANVIQH
jgi:hypothetical protein